MINKIIFAVLILTFAGGQLFRFGGFGPDTTIQINDLAVAVSVILLFLTNRKSLKRISGSPLFKPLLIWYLAMFLSLAVNFPGLGFHNTLVSSLYAIRFAGYSFLFFAVSEITSKEKLRVRKGLLFSTLAVAVIGIVQYIFIPDTSFLKAYNWDDHYYRLISTFLDPGFTGAILSLGLISVFALYPKMPLKLWAVAGTIYLALALTYSRASYLMYLAGFGVISFYRKSIRYVFIALFILVITIPILPKSTGEGTKLTRENSILARINNWEQSAVIFWQHPVLGIGFDSYRYLKIAETPDKTQSLLVSHSGAGADSSILLVLSTTGLLGFLSFCYLAFAVLKTGKKDLLFIAGLFSVFIHSWFNNTLFYPWIMEWLWLVLATGENT